METGDGEAAQTVKKSVIYIYTNANDSYSKACMHSKWVLTHGKQKAQFFKEMIKVDSRQTLPACLVSEL